ncbi:uncharacterized protein IL334_003344 [Kwoniella shivajii]|uniref:Uncharacterized protein n=1 Tax=Kwoniella shivajii TaxID=564305 RepID=A0ABZ1CYK4_9TREE|nr:hypothetical protein IL334_003344 [Kwoniella shivajii]
MSSSIARPLTPFPHTHTLTHGSHSSYFHHIPFESQPHAYKSQPIHFQLKTVHSPVPPSLIRRSSSNSRYHPSPSLSYEGPLRTPKARRVSSSSSYATSSSSSSMESPSLPVTPVLESSSEYSTFSDLLPTTPLELPPRANKASSYETFNYDPYSTSLSTGEEIATGFSHQILERPKFIRRDTPIPKTSTLKSLKMSTRQDENGRKLLKSVIDGGNWVIVG